MCIHICITKFSNLPTLSETELTESKHATFRITLHMQPILFPILWHIMYLILCQWHIIRQNEFYGSKTNVDGDLSHTSHFWIVPETFCYVDFTVYNDHSLNVNICSWRWGSICVFGSVKRGLTKCVQCG